MIINNELLMEIKIADRFEDSIKQLMGYIIIFNLSKGSILEYIC